jgi:hypothetical protein
MPPPLAVVAGVPKAGLFAPPKGDDVGLLFWPNPPKPPDVAVFPPNNEPPVEVLLFEPKPPPPVFELPKPPPNELVLLVLPPKPKDMAATASCDM